MSSRVQRTPIFWKNLKKVKLLLEIKDDQVLYLKQNIFLGNYLYCILVKKQTRNATWPGTIYFIFVIILSFFALESMWIIPCPNIFMWVQTWSSLVSMKIQIFWLFQITINFLVYGDALHPRATSPLYSDHMLLCTVGEMQFWGKLWCWIQCCYISLINIARYIFVCSVPSTLWWHCQIHASSHTFETLSKYIVLMSNLQFLASIFTKILLVSPTGSRKHNPV
jgi:hypothetical protein